MKTTAITKGATVTTVSGKVYTATGRTFRMSGTLWIEIVDEDGFTRSLENRCVASVVA